MLSCIGGLSFFSRGMFCVSVWSKRSDVNRAELMVSTVEEFDTGRH